MANVNKNVEVGLELFNEFLDSNPLKDWRFERKEGEVVIEFRFEEVGE